MRLGVGLGLDVDQHLGIPELVLDRRAKLVRQLMGALEGRPGAKLDVQVDVTPVSIYFVPVQRPWADDLSHWFYGRSRL